MITKVQSCFTRNATDPETFDGERKTAECARQTYTDFVKLKHVFGSGKKKSMCLPTALSIVIAKRHFSDCLGVFISTSSMNSLTSVFKGESTYSDERQSTKSQLLAFETPATVGSACFEPGFLTHRIPARGATNFHLPLMTLAFSTNFAQHVPFFLLPIVFPSKKLRFFSFCARHGISN